VPEPGPQLLRDVRRQGGQQLDHSVGDISRATAQLGQMIVALDQFGDRSVESQVVQFFAHGCNRAMHNPFRLVIGIAGEHTQLAAVFVDHVPPQPLQEAVYADNILAFPRA